ncbi:MAG TPA: transcriptional repressor [Thermotogota bacterium]|nr:transcriptional repressor [Thermotogota bacterium]HPJ87607.1 transcriptional repressor [Thermotogota bacterium]HPR94812.1 transcriptional repressor [Thermotogota bacterium]
MVNDILRKELKNRNFRITAQRELIMKIFAESPEDHLSVEEVYRKLLDKRSRISKATVYRTVELLSELDLLRKIEIDEGIIRYELADSNKHGKHHAICTDCGEVITLSDELMEKIEKLLKDDMGFIPNDHNIKFYGKCANCDKNLK